MVNIDNIMVIDSIMGSGKTNYAINTLKENPEERVMYEE